MKTADKQAISRPWLRAACAGLAVVAIAIGCSSLDATAPARSSVQSEPNPVAPTPSQFGPAPAKIVSVNPELRFVVIDFSSRVMPPVGTRLQVYRGEKPIGVVRVTEPTRAQLATADIVEGDVRVGDEAR
jgi:hypothetical protein